jgi:predicted GH43/DUF377 family glycosyl hydrolase
VRDATGKYLSHVAYVDLTKDFSAVVAVSAKPVIGLGNLGCFDEHGIFPLNVVRSEDKLLGYIGGWSRRVSVSVDGSIGISVSEDDGKTFKRLGDGPVLTATANEPFLIGDPFVQRYDDLFHMWYIFGTEWQRPSDGSLPERIYKIGHATSSDGIIWEKNHEGRSIVANRLSDTECQALPTVVKLGSRYHMVFCCRHALDFRTNRHRGYRLGHAFSDDLVNWRRDDDSLGIDATEGDWDSDMMCYPHIFKMDGEVYMMYNGNEFGRFGFGVAKLDK